MWRTTWKGLLGHKLRLALTALAIVLGTSFVSGSFVFTDTLAGVFDRLFASALAGTDVVVRAQVDSQLTFAIPDRLPASLVDTIRGVDGVEGAAGTVGGIVTLSQNGERLGGQGPPTIGSAWIDTGNPLELRSGHPPQADDEVVIDAASAARFGLDVGDRVQVTGLGKPETFTVVGTVGLGSSDGFGGATALAFTRPTADRLFGANGQVDAINVVAAPGVTPAQLIERITPLLPDRVQAIDSRTAAEEQLTGFKQALGFINTFLLVFGFVSLFVGAFIIQNTFRIVVTQRTRELAMLRAVGATRGQVLRMVLTEAGLVGLVASGLGVLAGVGLATGIRLLFRAFGGDLPSGALVVRPRTALVGLAAGVTVTVASAVLPAVAASRIPPVAAMREALALPRRRSLRRRAITGAVLTAGGVTLLWAGLRGALPSTSIAPAAVVGAGAGVVFIGVAVLTPLFARPVGRTIGKPISAAGTVGKLATENAVRSPRRTSATSAAVMIGTALAGLALILGSSLSTTTDALIADRFRSDLIVQPSGFGGAELSPEIATELRALPEVARLVAVRRSVARVGEDRLFVASADLATLARLVRFDEQQGTLADVGDGGVAVSRDLADTLGLALGDRIDVTFARSGDQPLIVQAIFQVDGPGADAYITDATWNANFTERFDSSIFVDLADGVDLEQGRAALETVTDTFPGAEVLDENQFADEAKSQIRQFVGLVFALLGLTLLIGFFGILNTLLLSIIERRREIGLLRAVGTTRRQLAAMVTWEAVIVAVFGALLGIALGIFFGWALVTAIQADSELILDIPWSMLGVAVTAAAVAGVAAAVYPAWRASRLNVLQAIAYE